MRECYITTEKAEEKQKEFKSDRNEIVKEGKNQKRKKV